MATRLGYVKVVDQKTGEIKQQPSGYVQRVVALRMGNKDVDFIVSLYLDGTIGFREKGRKSGSEVHVPLTTVYTQAVIHEGKKEQQEKRQRRVVKQVSRGLLSLERTRKGA